jgi:DNA processing protein
MAEARRLIRATSKLAKGQLQRARDSNAEIISFLDPNYPDALRQLELPPPVLYIQGRIPTSPAIAIVGSRQATPQGIEAAELFGRELASCGLTVVSGFARGIDLAAHRGALSSADGQTVAVLGCGLDVDYPKGRQLLRRLLPSRGALVSEFPFGAQPRSWNFPVRNRIIAALSLGILVVQGAPRSGSLITARLALDLGKDVYAVPGSIFDRRAAGPNALIQDGALLVRHPHEIVESLPMSIRDSLSSPGNESRSTTLAGPLGELLKAMPPGQMVTAEHLAATTGHGLDQILGVLLELEMTGLIRRFPGAIFCRKP